MQKSDSKNEDHQNHNEHSAVTLACPRCGNEKIRRSSKRASDGSLNVLFYKAYRCQACRFRFWMINPLRLFVFIGLILLLIAAFGALWITFRQESEIVNPAETASQDEIKTLAEKGNADAELQMGLRHTSIAWGVKDDKSAVHWFEKAAQHNQIEAQYLYGMALLDGRGAVQNYKSAFYWLEKAASKGHAKAQSALGEMYNAGIAVKTDAQRAYLWFNLAAAQGEENAATARDIVVKLLTTDQITAMQQEASRISRDYHSTSNTGEHEKPPAVK